MPSRQFITRLCQLMFILVLGVLCAATSKADALCTTNTLSFYEANVTTSANGCSIGSLNFWDFDGGNAGVTGSGPGTLAASRIELTPVSTSEGVGFMITWMSADGFQATATGVRDVELPFLVACADGTACITDITMSLTGTATGTTSGGQTPGQVQLTETYCLGGITVPPTAPCSSGGVKQEYLTITPITSGTPSRTDTFSGVSEIAMNKDIQALGNNGTATVGSVEDLFSTTGSPTTPPTSTPEPGSLLLLLVGITGLGLASRRRQAQPR